MCSAAWRRAAAGVCTVAQHAPAQPRNVTHLLWSLSQPFIAAAAPAAAGFITLPFAINLSKCQHHSIYCTEYKTEAEPGPAVAHRKFCHG